MNRKTIITVVIVAILGFGVLAIGLNSNDSNSSNSSQQQEPIADGYVPYSETAIADAAGTKRVLFFHASWCPTCLEFEEEILEQGVPSGVTIIQADYDKDTKLRQQYKVTVQSTFVLLDDNAQTVEQWNFGRGLNDISDLYSSI